MSQVYFIDGQALGPENFGFTDPLTGTWRPKKYTGTFTQSSPNNGTTWTNNTTSGSGTIANAYDGDGSTWCNITSGNTFTLTPPSTIVADTVEVWLDTDTPASFSINGGTFSSENTYSGLQFVSVATDVSLTSLAIRGGSGGSGIGLRGIRINGEILLDGLNNTGANSFYLPMDGNSPIGQDKSGNGNDWTPINFGGSNSVDKATGALPILEGPGGTVANVGVRTDANASSLVLALPLIGNKEDVHHLIKGSGSAKSVTGNGNVVANYSFGNFYGGSYYFDGSADSLTVASSSDLGMGTGDFTIEAWVHPTQLYTSNFIVCLSGSDSVFGYGNDGTLNIQLPSSGAPALTQLGPKITNNEWNHFACVRESGNLRAYVNGVLAATVSNATTNMGASGTATIGDHPSLSREIKGYLQDVRIYKGVAKYTSNFVPASTNPDILPDTPSGVSGSSKLTKITDGAVSFDGSSDYLSVSDSNDFDLAGNDWTVEAFVYHSSTNYASYEGILAQWVLGSGTARTWTLETVGSGSTSDLEFYYYDTSDNFVGPVQGGTLSKNRWHHVAACRSGNTIRMFVDGVMYGSGTTINVDIKNSTDPLWIGRVVDGYWNGHISNARVVNGTALYTSNFTPPSAPLTEVTNTKILCCQSPTSAVDTTFVPGTAPNTRNWSARTNWNSGGTLTNASSYPLTAAFDGNLNTTFAMSYAGGMIWTAPSTISFSSSIEVYVNSSIGTGGQGFIATISGVQQSKVDLNAAGSWETLYSGSGTFDKLEITRNNGGNNNNLWISAIRVDGTVLVDAIAGHGDAVATTFNPFNTDIHTVRGQETGYATLNPLFGGTDKLVLSDGNLTAAATGTNAAGNWKGAVSTLGATSGKWYAEFLVVALGGSNHANIGINPIPKQTTPLQGQSDGGHFYNVNGGAWNAGSISNGVHTMAVKAGDTIGVTVDFDASQIKWYLNGVLDYTVTLNTNIINNGFVWALTNYTTSTVKATLAKNPLSSHHLMVFNH